MTSDPANGSISQAFGGRDVGYCEELSDLLSGQIAWKLARNAGGIDAAEEVLRPGLMADEKVTKCAQLKDAPGDTGPYMTCLIQNLYVGADEITVEVCERGRTVVCAMVQELGDVGAVVLDCVLRRVALRQGFEVTIKPAVKA